MTIRISEQDAIKIAKKFAATNELTTGDPFNVRHFSAEFKSEVIGETRDTGEYIVAFRIASDHVENIIVNDETGEVFRLMNL